MKIKALFVIILLITGYMFGQTKPISITSPVGGEKWDVGFPYNITWTSSGVTKVKIEFSKNNGYTWSTIIASVSASLGTYAWTIPDSASTQCRIRISDTSNASIKDSSASKFTIEYRLVTLHDINYQPDSTAAGWPNSPLAGYTVRVRGTVLCRPLVDPTYDRRAIMYFGAALGTYIEAPDGSPWGGLNIYQADSTKYATQFDLCDTASTYEFTGVVSPYGQATELILKIAPTPVPVNLISQEVNRPTPKILTLDSCFNADGSFNVKLRKYLGMYVSFQPDSNSPNLITSNLITGQTSTAGGFNIDNGNGNMIQMYAQSRYFKTSTGTTGYGSLRPTYVAPANGTHMSYVSGLLEAYSNMWEIVPLYPNDIGPLKATPPTITNCRRNPGVVPQNTSVTVTCTVVGNMGAIVQKVQLFKTVNGVLDSLNMTKGTGTDSTTYTGTIPGIASDSAFVNYYVKATDNTPLSSTSPDKISNSRYSFFVLKPSTPFTIQHVRYSPFGNAYSGYHGYQVTVSGVVTADTSKIGGSNANNPPRVYIQNGSTPWSGIILGYAGTYGMSVFDLKQGDLITVTGTPVSSATAYATRLDTLTALTIESHHNTLPASHVMKTGDVGYSALGTLTAEPWNGCIVTYNAFRIDSANADGPTYHYGESYGKDTSGGNHTRVTWSDGRTQFYNGPADGLAYLGDYFGSITGVLEYTHTNYKLCPRDSNDIVGYKPFVTGVRSDNSVLPTQYKLNQNFPNPFNPSTVISYAIPKSGIVTLKIFNVLGQQVKTLVNQSQTAGTHQVTFNANSLSSGVYFYSLTVDNFTSVKKMMLIK